MPSTAIDTVNSLTTLNRVKLYIQSTGGTTFDTRINGLIDAVSHEFNSRTGRLLKARTLTEYYDGNGKSSLYLNQYPIRSQSSSIDVRVLSYRNDHNSATTEFTTAYKVPSSYLVVYSSEGRIQRTDGAFTFGNRNVKVVYIAGYAVGETSTSSTSIPADLRNAVHEQIAWQFDRNRSNRHGIQSMSQDAGSKSYALGEPPTIEPVLARYRDSR